MTLFCRFRECICIVLGIITITNQADIWYEWTFVDYEFSTIEERSQAIDNGSYIQRNVIIYDSDYWITPDCIRRVFVTTPRLRPGIPATLSEVSDQKSNDSYLLAPFPNWAVQTPANCDSLYAIWRIYIDKCGLLWAVDGSVTETYEPYFGYPPNCPPRILVYDLAHNDTLLVKYEFPESQFTSQSGLGSLVTECYNSDCKDSIAYIVDVSSFSLFVYSMPQNTSWRLSNNFFYPFPRYGTFYVNGAEYDLMQGIFGVSLSPASDTATRRKLYFHALASLCESWVATSDLKNITIATDSNALRSLIVTSEDARESQSGVEVITNHGVLLYSILSKNAIACWNISLPFTKENQHIVYQDDENLQYINSMKLRGNQLLLLSNKYSNYIVGESNSTDIKYRIIYFEDICEQLLKGTPCSCIL